MFVAQKLGTAKPTQEPEQFQQMLKAFQINRQELKDLTERAQALLTANEQLIEAENAFASVLGKLGEALRCLRDVALNILRCRKPFESGDQSDGDSSGIRAYHAGSARASQAL